MKPLAITELPPQLMAQLPPAADGWVPLSVPSPRHHILLPDSRSTDSLLQSFREFTAAIEAHGPFIMLCDGHSGWRFVPKAIKRDPLLVADVAEVDRFIRARSQFRRKFFDNYYVCDHSLNWIASFCHDDDIHLWLSENVWMCIAFQRWRRVHKPTAMAT